VEAGAVVEAVRLVGVGKVGSRNYIVIKRKEIVPGHDYLSYQAIEIRFTRNDYKVCGKEDLPFEEYFLVGSSKQLDSPNNSARFDTLEEALGFFDKACSAIIDAHGGIDKCKITNGWSA
jgi:hypothetical protein